MVYPVPWYLSLFITFPQTMVILLLGFSLLNLKIPINKYIIISLTYSFISYFVRKFPISLTTNSLIFIFTIIVLLVIIARIKPVYSLFSVLVGFILYAIIETVVIYSFLCMTSYDINSIMTNSWLELICFIPCLLFSIGIYLLIKRYQFIIYDLSVRRINVSR